MLSPNMHIYGSCSSTSQLSDSFHSAAYTLYDAVTAVELSHKGHHPISKCAYHQYDNNKSSFIDIFGVFHCTVRVQLYS